MITPGTNPPDTTSRWFRLARLGAGLVILAALATYAAILPYSFRALVWNEVIDQSLYVLRFALSRWAFTALIVGLNFLGLAVSLAVGLMLYILRVWRRRQNDWVSLLAALTFVMLPFTFMSEPFAIWFPKPWGDILVISASTFNVLGPAFFINFMFIFPDGRFIPGWMRFTTWVFNLTLIPLITSIIVFPEMDAVGFVNLWAVFIITFLSVIVLAIFSQVYRYRLSSPLQRQQTKLVLVGIFTWPLYSLVAGLGILPTSVYVAALLTLVMQTLLVVLLPVTVLLSIYRYRLWDIDLIIRRSLIYGGVTVTLAAIYFASILLFQRLFFSLTGQNSNISLVLSTLLIAGLFNPLRKRIQTDIDRRFYRRKYDAQKIMQEFSATARSNVSLEEISAALLAVTDEALQPGSSSLWLTKK